MMRYIILICMLLSVYAAKAQPASRLNANQNTGIGFSPTNVLFVDTAAGNQFRIYGARLDSLKRMLVRLDSMYAVTRTLNSNYTISATRGSWGMYSISIASNAGSVGTVFLEYSVDAITWVEAGRISNSSSGAANTQICQVVGRFPANYFIRLRTTGAATITYISGQEVVL